jgi:predicted O-methyltransferase YrrM
MSLREEYDRRRSDESSDIYHHLSALFGHVAECRSEDPVVLELGTRTGNSTAAFLYALQVRQCGILHSVDIEAPDVPEDWYRNPQWNFHLGSDTDPRILGAVLPVHPGIDVLFVDTSHTYEHTLAELVLCMPLVKPGGIALFHDTEVVSEVCHVARALDEYCADVQKLWHPQHELSWTNDRACYGLGTIRVPE